MFGSICPGDVKLESMYTDPARHSISPTALPTTPGFVYVPVIEEPETSSPHNPQQISLTHQLYNFSSAELALWLTSPLAVPEPLPMELPPMAPPPVPATRRRPKRKAISFDSNSEDERRNPSAGGSRQRSKDKSGASLQSSSTGGTRSLSASCYSKPFSQSMDTDILEV